METATRPARRHDVVFRPLADEWVILDPRTNELHVLNLSAALLWEQIDGTRTPEQIGRSVWTAFGEGPSLEGVQSEVAAGIEDFDRKGLLA